MSLIVQFVNQILHVVSARREITYPIILVFHVKPSKDAYIAPVLQIVSNAKQDIFLPADNVKIVQVLFSIVMHVTIR